MITFDFSTGPIIICALAHVVSNGKVNKITKIILKGRAIAVANARFNGRPNAIVNSTIDVIIS